MSVKALAQVGISIIRTVVLGLNVKAQVMAINFCEAALCCLRIMEE